MVDEIWQPVPGYEDLYEASDHGRVRVLDRVLKFKRQAKILKPSPWHGYPSVTLTDSAGKRRHLTVHRLVADAFVSNPSGFKYVNHLDYDRANPLPHNLEWCTWTENIQHGVDRRMGFPREYPAPAPLAQEIWVPIPSYEGLYEVSSHGRTRVHAREIETMRAGHILTPDRDKDGYFRITLTKTNDTSKHFGVHQVVAMTFLPNPDGLKEVAHIDHNRRNNVPPNLKWASRSGNHSDSVIEDRYALSGPNLGTKRTFTADEIRSIRARYAAGERQAELAKSTGIRIETIRKIVMRQRWAHIA